MKRDNRHYALAVVAAAIMVLSASGSSATTIAQNSAWNVTRTGADETFRVVAYGDSIFAGYTSATNISRRAAPHVAAEYGAAAWGQNVEVRRRCQSGAVAQGVYNRINSATDRAFMQTANTRVVTFEMCGNDYLQARSTFRGQAGVCNYAVLTNAGVNCQTYTELAMQSINTHAHPNAKLKIVSNLYYPGWNADNVLSNCTDPDTGVPGNLRERFFPLLAESNWTTCKLAEQYGFECADSFAEYMGADYDSNGDGIVDSEALRYRSDESLEDYIQRVTVDLFDTIRDANFKLTDPMTSFDYLLSDDTHPTFIGPTSPTLFTTPGGNVAVQFPTDGAYPDGKNPVWNQVGHDRMGWELTRSYDLTVDAGPDATILACETFESEGSFEDKIFTGPWTLDVDYGNGSTTSEEVTETTFALVSEYTAPDTYDVEVSVEGPYGTIGSDSATVTVLSAGEAVQDLIGQIAALKAAGKLNSGQANSRTQILNNVLGKINSGAIAEAQAMLGGFISGIGDFIANGVLSAEDGQALIDYAQRVQAAAACNP